jgi:nitrite reductase (cytochrome c-552)
MPYMREGATKISDHWVRSPLLNVNRACQTCHRADEAELKSRVDAIQQRTYDLMQRAGVAVVDLIDAIQTAKAANAAAPGLESALTAQRRAQWRLDFIAAENSMGFHAPQEAARILGEAIDYARQGQVAVLGGVVTQPPPAPTPAVPLDAPAPGKSALAPKASAAAASASATPPRAAAPAATLPTAAPQATPAASGTTR